MLSYAFMFLLINVYGRSLGVPLKENSNGKILIGNLLSELSKQCKNEFVLGQINKIHACNVELPPYRDVNLQCLLFYDANRLMCNLSTSNTDLATEFSAKASEKQNVSIFCSEAAHLNVPFTVYQPTITYVLQNEVACTKVCTDDDIRTGDTGFFCKYYKWTLEKFNTPQTSTHVLKPTTNPVSSAVSGSPEKKDDATATQLGTVSASLPKITLNTAPSDIKEQSENYEANQHPSEVVEQNSVPQSPGAQDQESSKLPSEGESTIEKNPENSVHTQEASEKANDGIDKQPNPSGEPNEADVDINLGVKNPDIPQIETQGQKIGQDNIDPDDASMDMEGDDGKDGNIDNGEDGDVPNDADMEVRLDEEMKNSRTQTDSKISITAEGSKDIIQMSNGFPEDDDHFFPFFLTTVIVVALLYVLYHNKNKVGKMFFGLIVEGRQTGRRRNSRGHAYRRLDTLEQAMSANACAPPSKIIY